MLQDAADRLAQHAASRTSAVVLAEVELETRQSAVASQEQVSAQAIEMRRQAQSALDWRRRRWIPSRRMRLVAPKRLERRCEERKGRDPGHAGAGISLNLDLAGSHQVVAVLTMHAQRFAPSPPPIHCTYYGVLRPRCHQTVYSMVSSASPAFG